MTTHSKGKYVAFRSKRDALTRKQIAARMRIAAELKAYCMEPFQIEEARP